MAGILFNAEFDYLSAYFLEKRSKSDVRPLLNEILSTLCLSNSNWETLRRRTTARNQFSKLFSKPRDTDYRAAVLRETLCNYSEYIPFWNGSNYYPASILQETASPVLKNDSQWLRTNSLFCLFCKFEIKGHIMFHFILRTLNGSTPFNNLWARK